MANSDLKKFAQTARRQLREQVAARLEQVLKTDSAALREREAARKELSQQIAETSKKTVIDRVAYTWFNRLCALRFMDVNRYNRIGAVSPAEGFSQPEILQEAKQGYIDEDLQKYVDCPTVFDLLGGRRPSIEPQQEAYRLLLVGVCNSLNLVMPFLFEPIADYTELLMPQDLLSEHSILHDLREVLTPEACQDVEVIGWLYQFYISERKDEVFEALKQNQKIAPEDIPAATQLFTPHWIVRYLVENSLGRLWMLNFPQSRLTEKMEYYIRSEQEETDFLHITSPEEIKVCDPACGSGHMLTYAFDLLYSIYEEQGYGSNDIPRLILEKNLYGIEIDERAGALAAFALVMKARGRDRRFFDRQKQFDHLVLPQICVLDNITFTEQELKEYTAAMGQDLFTEPLIQTLKQFDQAKTYGSLIKPFLTDITFVRNEIERKNLGGNIFLFGAHNKILRMLKQVEFLSSRYGVTIANPPYMGAGSFNEELKEFSQKQFPNSKTDLFAMFVERNLDLVRTHGFIAMITMHNWMFISSYEAFRKALLEQNSIINMAHLGARAFDSIGGEVVSTTAFILKPGSSEEKKGHFIRLVNGGNEAEKSELLREAVTNIACSWMYHASKEDFKKVPGMPIVYWISEKWFQTFKKPPLSSRVISPGRCKTHNDASFVRFFWEVPEKSIGIENQWKFISHGGEFRKWFGNRDHVVNWSVEARKEYAKKGGLSQEKFWSREGICWSDISSGVPAFRLKLPDSENTSQGPAVLVENPNDLLPVLGFLNSKCSKYLLSILNPTFHTNPGDVQRLPFSAGNSSTKIVNDILEIAKDDWNSYETSMGFKSLPLLNLNLHDSTLQQTTVALQNEWRVKTLEMQQLEEINNQTFIEAYNLLDELTAEVPLAEITLTCNPYYRYGIKQSETVIESLMLADIIREFISYAVGCMFGRYSIDKPGLVLANQGETLQDYLRQVPDPTFMPDEDNAIPVLDGEWFNDDITERFKKFLRITFGTEHYEENLAFIEQAIGRDIRSYFLKEFYSQHIKMYQRRPIYWMFSSPRGSFNVLIYMHRYQPDTISVILNRYLREFRGKLEGRKAHLEQVSISASSTQREKTLALKEIEELNKILEEIRVYERDVLYPLAVQGIKINLDDGVKVNYVKFGKALAKITGLSV